MPLKEDETDKDMDKYILLTTLFNWYIDKNLVSVKIKYLREFWAFNFLINDWF